MSINAISESIKALSKQATDDLVAALTNTGNTAPEDIGKKITDAQGKMAAAGAARNLFSKMLDDLKRIG